MSEIEYLSSVITLMALLWFCMWLLVGRGK